MSDLFCPSCGEWDWIAVEQFTSMTPCRLQRQIEGVEIIFDMRAELARESASSIVLAYRCSNESCGYTVEAHRLESLREEEP